jgi:hypothetical protein
MFITNIPFISVSTISKSEHSNVKVQLIFNLKYLAIKYRLDYEYVTEPICHSVVHTKNHYIYKLIIVVTAVGCKKSKFYFNKIIYLKLNYNYNEINET